MDLQLSDYIHILEKSLLQKGGQLSVNLPDIEPGSTPTKTAPNSVHQANMLATTSKHTGLMQGAICDNPLSLQGAIRDSPLQWPPKLRK